MSAQIKCRECGNPIALGAGSGLCPRCLLNLGLEAGKQESVEESQPHSEEREQRMGELKDHGTSGQQPDKSPEIILAFEQGKAGQCPPMRGINPVPGDLIGDYEILEKIGGNMGLVFRARHRLLDKVVALKLLPAEGIAEPARLARFQREIRVMGQLEHPNLVTAADARIVDSWHLVAMEWIDGIDLYQLLQAQGPLPIPIACEVARQTALGLHCAHQHGLIHRDIKPSNLMLTRTGTIKVIDMGLALILEDSTAQLTQSGLVLGTMSYCAPEQFRDPSTVDIRADIYSLGCTLYHLLTGKPPYWQRKTFPEVVQAHLNEPFPSLVQVRPDAPATLEKVLEDMTAKDPNSRFASTTEVTDALEPFARGSDLKPFLPPPTPATSRHQVTPRPAPGERSPPSASQLKPAWFRWAAVFLLAILGAALLFTECRKHTPTVPLLEYDPFTQGFPVPEDQLVIVMMDTTARGGIYDPDNYDTGGSNAKEVAKVLQERLGLRTSCLHQENISLGWRRQSFVSSLHPHLVIIHRSAFFHPQNAIKKYGERPQFTNPWDDPRWVNLYKEADDEFIKVLAHIGAAVRYTQFLVYSRGTDPQWLVPGFQETWKAQIESEFPELKGRIFTMTIDRGKQGSFRNPETSSNLVQRVKERLRLPDKPQ